MKTFEPIKKTSFEGIELKEKNKVQFNPFKKDSDNDYLIGKFVFLGDRRSQLINKYIGMKIKIVGDFLIKYFTDRNHNSFQCQLWDLTVTEGLMSPYFKNACCVVITFDMEDPQALASANKYLGNAQKYIQPNEQPVIAIVGNYENANNIQLSEDAIKEFAAKNNISLCFATSMNETNVSNVMNEIIQSTIDHYSHLFNSSSNDASHDGMIKSFR